MFLRQTLNQVRNFSTEQLSQLSDLLSPELIDQLFLESGVATIQKRRLLMETRDVKKRPCRYVTRRPRRR